MASINLKAQTAGAWNTLSGVAQTTTTNAVGIGTTTLDAYFNLVNPLFAHPDGGFFSYDPIHVQNSGLGTMLKLNSYGRFGLNTANPNSMFHLHISNSSQSVFEITKTISSNTSRVYFDPRLVTTSQLALNPIIKSKDAGIIFSDNNTSNNSTSGFVIAPRSSTKSGLRISANGDVEIMNGRLVMNDGSNNQFSISNNGYVRARQFDVDMTTIPDYVFHNAFCKDSATKYRLENTYKMLSLKEVESYVQLNKHLPGIKSAVEYQAAGSVNLGELNIKLLEKVEELTLYNIQLMKEIEAIKLKQENLEIKLNNQ